MQTNDRCYIVTVTWEYLKPGVQTKDYYWIEISALDQSPRNHLTVNQRIISGSFKIYQQNEFTNHIHLIHS